MHAVACFKVMRAKDSNVFESFNPERRRQMRRLVTRTILATDMQSHSAHIRTGARAKRECVQGKQNRVKH